MFLSTRQAIFQNCIFKASFRTLLTIATPRDFKHFSDYHDDAFRFNLHTHTNASDGRISPEDWLDYMSAYADLTAQHIPADNKPFLTAAITDHDTTKGAVAALKALIRNPEKYKNLRIVLGCEFSTHYKDKTRLKAPLPFEMIGYSINPFDKGINKRTIFGTLTCLKPPALC